MSQKHKIAPSVGQIWNFLSSVGTGTEMCIGVFDGIMVFFVLHHQFDVLLGN